MSKMGFFGLGEEGYDRVYSDRELFTRVIKLFKPHRRSMIIVIIFICLTSVTYGLTPFLLSLIIKQLESQFNPLILIIFLINIVILNSLGYVFNYVNRRQGNRMVYRVCYNLRRKTNMRVL